MREGMKWGLNGSFEVEKMPNVVHYVNQLITYHFSGFQGIKMTNVVQGNLDFFYLFN